MPQLFEPELLELAEPGETVWMSWNENEVLMKRDCTAGCDKGLVFTPAEAVQFCWRCSGDGYVVRHVPTEKDYA